MKISKKIMGIGASPRANGNSDILLKQILKGAKAEKVDAAASFLRDYDFKSCIGCERCRKEKICTGLKDGMTLLYPEIMESKAMVWVSPTHTYNVTAMMKAFIDRLYCFYTFEDTRPRNWASRLAGQDRKILIATICEQVDAEDMGVTMEAMRLPAKAMGYEVVEEIVVFDKFDRGIIKEDGAVMERAFEAGKQLALLL